MADFTIRAGENFDLYFDSYTDATHTTRISYAGWRYVLTLRAGPGEAPFATYASDATPAKLTLVAAPTGTPAGQRLALHLSASDTAGLASGGFMGLHQIDPADASNSEPLIQPLTFTLAGPV